MAFINILIIGVDVGGKCKFNAVAASVNTLPLSLWARFCSDSTLVSSVSCTIELIFDLLHVM